MLKSVARVWLKRERVEKEAADLFFRLSDQLKEIDAHPKLVQLAHQAGCEEEEHAVLCRKIVETYDPSLKPLKPVLGICLGPKNLSPSARALYTSVALSCVTETLSAALLLQMRESAKETLIASTVHHILKDEIRHSRLGWAHLADEAKRTDVHWLAPHLKGMLHDAIKSDLKPMVGESTMAQDLSAYGILPRQKVQEIVQETVKEVLLPGFQAYGIHTQGIKVSSASDAL